MKQVTVHEAKTHLSRLLREVEAGEEIVVARGKVRVARIVAIDEPLVRREFGAMRGRARCDDAFFEPLPDELLEFWGS